MGGGGPDIPERNFSDEWPGIKQGYKGQINQYRQFAKKEPLLTGSTEAALTGLGDIENLQGPLRDALAYLAPIIKSGGALTPDQQREAEQSSLALSEGAGMANSNAGIADALLNRDRFKRERFREALGEASGSISGIQGVTSSAIAPALATEEARTGAFSKLTNPILAYMSDLFSSNQNAAAAESVAGANKSGGAAGGALSAVGSIASAVLPALMAFSDEDLKTNIKDTGLKTASGIPIKRWQYKGDDRWFEGPIAQDVEKVHPEAVGRSRVTGHRFVDLDKTDVPFHMVDGELRPLKRATVVRSALLTEV